MASRELAVILGAGPGLGQALARRFAAGGCDLALLARDPDRLGVLAPEIAGETGRKARGFAADATDLAGFRAAMARVQDEMGPVSVFLHAVSRWIPKRAAELDPEVLQAEMRLSVGAALMGTQMVLAGMEAAGRGTVLWTGSGMALAPEKNGATPALGTSKVALRALALASARDFHARGINFGTITVNGTIAPGTPFAPERIAGAFWAAHVAPRAEWRAERVFDGRD